MASRGDEWMPLPKNEAELEALFFQNKRHPAMKMANTALRMNRLPNHVFILVAGFTGAGKSSTINYLFDTKIETNNMRSTTRSTTEYKITLKSDEWKIKQLPLSIIDTPGFGDTDNLRQEVKNIKSIKCFMEEKLKEKFPNLVMIMQPIGDIRFDGEGSNFVKMLKGISIINAIDYKNPNVVVVLTFAASIGTNAKFWEEDVKMKKSQVDAVVHANLGIHPEIVVQENKPEKHDLKKKDKDWYSLPNGDLQPKILYQACERILNRTNDQIGHEAVAVCFRPGPNKTFKMESTIPSSKFTTEECQPIFDKLFQLVTNTAQSEVYSMLQKYKIENKMTFLNDFIIVLQSKFDILGVFKAKDLQKMSINKLMKKMRPTIITKEMQKILHDVFGLSYEQSASNDYNVGKGYNIFKDAVTTYSPLVVRDDDNTQCGLPKSVILTECSSLEIKCESIKDTSDYVGKRLRNLNVDTDRYINFEVFNLQDRHGYNLSNESSNSAGQMFQKSSFLIEYRNQKLEVQPPFKIAKKFESEVKDLPEDFNLNDENGVFQWKAFFDKWGMYVVVGEYLGGSLTGQVVVEKEQSCSTTIEDAYSALGMKMSFIQRDTSLDFKNNTHSSFTKSLSALHSFSVTWSGGNRKTYQTPLEDIGQSEWKTWVESLEYFPVPLCSSINLLPIVHLVSEVSPEKGAKMQMAINAAFAGKLIYEVPEDHEIPGGNTSHGENKVPGGNKSHGENKVPEDNRENTGKSNESGKCFHENSLVILNNLKLKQMKDLSVGDKILITDDNGTISQDEIIAWLHQVKDGQFTFLQIVHEFGKITLTPDHIIFVGKSQKPQHASTLKPGDKLSFFTNDDKGQTVTMAIVLSIHKEKGRGIYAPLTYSGRLLVDKVDVSCYCTLNPLKVLGKDIISSHALAHAGFFPLRMAFKFGLNIGSSKMNGETGIHDYALWLMSVIFGK